MARVDDQQAETAGIERWARSFGAVVEAYERGRPGYPDAAAQWLIGREAAQVLELGAGTGKLTASLVAQGHDVVATEPDEAMLEVLSSRVPGARPMLATAERLPVADRTQDVVVAAQAFHWFDHQTALPEIARVLKPGGVLAVVWNHRDARIPWVRRLGELIGTHDQLSDPTEVLAESGLFEPPAAKDFKNWQDINRDILVDLVVSRSNVSTLGQAAQDAKLDEVRAFYDGFGRGYDGMQLPYLTHCFRSQLTDHRAADDEGGQESRIISNQDGSDTEMLLIDFR